MMRRWTEFRPTYFPPGNVVWFPPAWDENIVTVDAAVADPNDINTANWLGTNVANRTSISFTDTIDGAPLTHFIRQVPVPNLQLNHTAHYRIGIPPASGGGRYVIVFTNGGGGSVNVDAQAGVVLSQSGGNTGATYVNGVLEFDCNQATGTDFRFYTSTDGVIFNYVGAGTRSVTLGDNGLGVLVTITQRNVSQLTDRSGAGNNATQAAAAERPLLRTIGSRPATWYDGVNDDIATAAFGFNQPSTVYALLRRDAAAAGQDEGVDGTATATRLLFASAGTYRIFAGVGLDSGVVMGLDVSRLCGGVFDDVNSVASIDGAETAGAAGVAAATGISLGGAQAALNKWHGWVGEVAAWSRALPAAERSRVARALGARWGVSVA